MKWLILLKEYTIFPRRARRSQENLQKFAFLARLPCELAQHGRNGEGRAQLGPTFLFCELAQHGRNGEGRAQLGPTFLFRRRFLRS